LGVALSRRRIPEGPAALAIPIPIRGVERDERPVLNKKAAKRSEIGHPPTPDQTSAELRSGIRRLLVRHPPISESGIPDCRSGIRRSLIRHPPISESGNP
jgi:hypothetical protein